MTSSPHRTRGRRAQAVDTPASTPAERGGLRTAEPSYYLLSRTVTFGELKPLPAPAPKLVLGKPRPALGMRRTDGSAVSSLGCSAAGTNSESCGGGESRPARRAPVPDAPIKTASGGKENAGRQCTSRAPAKLGKHSDEAGTPRWVITSKATAGLAPGPQDKAAVASSPIVTAADLYDDSTGMEFWQALIGTLAFIDLYLLLFQGVGAYGEGLYGWANGCAVWTVFIMYFAAFGMTVKLSSRSTKAPAAAPIRVHVSSPSPASLPTAPAGKGVFTHIASSLLRHPQGAAGAMRNVRTPVQRLGISIRKSGTKVDAFFG